jgi:hypothetical protein
MWLSEELQMFVLQPLFHGSLNWESPLVPFLITLFVLVPVGYIVLKSMKQE